MSNSTSAEPTAAVAAALAELGVHPGERVLIMLPDGPGFAAAFAGTIKHGTVPLPINPLLFTHDIMATAAQSGARLLLASADQIQTLQTLTDLGAESPVLIDGPQQPWAAALRLYSPSKERPAKAENPTSDHHTTIIWRTGFRMLPPP